MTDWTHYNASKYAAKCCYCGRDIHTSEGRWTAPHTDGTKGRFNACHNCVAPPNAGISAAPPPKPNDLVTNDTRNDTPSVPSVSSVASSNPVPPVKPESIVESTHETTYTPMSPIAKAHADNMLNGELTRATLTCLNETIRVMNDTLVRTNIALHNIHNALRDTCNATNERTRVLHEHIEADSKGGSK